MVARGVKRMGWAAGAVLLSALLGAYAVMIRTPGKNPGENVPPFNEAELKTAAYLRTVVHRLAGEIGPRNEYYPEALAAAAGYITREFERMGYRPRLQKYRYRDREVVNIEVVKPSQSGTTENLIFGAHYDTCLDAPGADDNASGVAVLLGLADLLRDVEPTVNLRFVAFTLEEPPLFGSSWMGSYVYARALAQRQEKVRLMISLESLGYYRRERHTQHYPPLIRWFYPDRGDFLAIVTRVRDREPLRRFIRAFRSLGNFPAEGAALPGGVPGVAWSDHASFWKFGYPAVMLTDTAPYRNPNYHQESDLPETLDYRSMARITRNLAVMVRQGRW